MVTNPYQCEATLTRHSTRVETDATTRGHPKTFVEVNEARTLPSTASATGATTMTCVRKSVLRALARERRVALEWLDHVPHVSEVHTAVTNCTRHERKVSNERLQRLEVSSALPTVPGLELLELKQRILQLVRWNAQLARRGNRGPGGEPALCDSERCGRDRCSRDS